MMQSLRGYLVLPHAVPIIVVMAATAGFAVVAAGGWPGGWRLFWLLGAMFGAQLVIGVVNELVDADLDAVAKPSKPIPAGLVSRRGARIVAICGLMLMAAFSVRFGLASFALCALGTGAGAAYSLWFKRTVWSWIPYLVALPLLPIWVWTALSTVVQIAQSLPDVDADRGSNVRTLAVALGSARARYVCWGATLLAALLAAGFAPGLTDDPWLVWLAAGVACGLVGANAGIWMRDANAGALACFPCIAIGVVALGIGWAAALAGG
jgi:4-hydroxybenzoate polyprenyltransferase